MLSHSTEDTQAVVARHVRALMSRDLDALMDDYAEDAFFVSNLAPGAVRGLEQLRGFWAQALQVFTPDVLSNLKFAQQEIVGNVAYLLWSAGTAIPFGSDTFVVSGGKIAAQTGTIQFGQPAPGQ